MRAIGFALIVIGASMSGALAIGRAWSSSSVVEDSNRNFDAIDRDLRVMRTEILDEKSRGDMLERDLNLCRQRTENLRAVLEVLIPSGIWPERVRLPNPPPGWVPWPALGPDRTP